VGNWYLVVGVWLLAGLAAVGMTSLLFAFLCATLRTVLLSTRSSAACDEFSPAPPQILRFLRFLRVVLLVAAMPRCVLCGEGFGWPLRHVFFLRFLVFLCVLGALCGGLVLPAPKKRRGFSPRLSFIVPSNLVMIMVVRALVARAAAAVLISTATAASAAAVAAAAGRRSAAFNPGWRRRTALHSGRRGWR